MKRITKAQIKAAPQYILGIDWKADYKPLTIELHKLEATNLRDAMLEANGYWAWEDDRIWCISIYEKTDNVTEDGELVHYRDCVTAWARRSRTVIEEPHEACSWMTRWEEPCW